MQKQKNYEFDLECNEQYMLNIRFQINLIVPLPLVSPPYFQMSHALLPSAS